MSKPNLVRNTHLAHGRVGATPNRGHRRRSSRRGHIKAQGLWLCPDVVMGWPAQPKAAATQGRATAPCMHASPGATHMNSGSSTVRHAGTVWRHRTINHVVGELQRDGLSNPAQLCRNQAVVAWILCSTHMCPVGSTRLHVAHPHVQMRARHSRAQGLVQGARHPAQAQTNLRETSTAATAAAQVRGDLARAHLHAAR